MNDEEYEIFIDKVCRKLNECPNITNYSRDFYTSHSKYDHSDFKSKGTYLKKQYGNSCTICNNMFNKYQHKFSMIYLTKILENLENENVRLKKRLDILEKVE